MTDDKTRLLAEQIACELDKRRTVDEKTHAAHHQYIEYCISRDERRDEIIQNLKKRLVVWVVLGGLLGVWRLITYWYENFPHNGGGHG